MQNSFHYLAIVLLFYQSIDCFSLLHSMTVLIKEVVSKSNCCDIINRIMRDLFILKILIGNHYCLLPVSSTLFETHAK